MDERPLNNPLLDAVDRFKDLTVLVVGDVMLDEFIWGTVARISPEAPVPVVDVTHESRLLGGAANVINNLVSVGGRAALCGLIGPDRRGREVRSMLDGLGIETEGLMVDPDRPTTIKTRVVAHSQQVVRIDRELRRPLGASVLDGMAAYLETVADRVDAVIVSDYGKGVVCPPMLDLVRDLFEKRGRVVAVDPKVSKFRLYENVTVITPNHKEAALGAKIEIDSEETLTQAGRKLIEDLNLKAVLITRGEKGMALFERDRPQVDIPTVARKVFDVTGAGDTVIAIFTLGLAAGLDYKNAAVLANFAAGVVVGEVGTSAVTAEKLHQIVAASPWP